MRSHSSLALSILKWGVIWALGISLPIPFVTWALAPQMFGDGQYMMIFGVSFPLGWIIGAAVGITISKRDSSAEAGIGASAMAAAVAGLGCVTLPLLGVIFMSLIFAIVGVLMRAFGG